MAEKRMFSKKIIDTDWFMDMPASTQNLYFHLSMRADDDGFVASPKRIIKLIGASEDDYKVLVIKKFVIPFDSGICVIKDWRINNYLRNDRYTETIYKQEKNNLIVNENGEYELGIPNGIPLVASINSISNTISGSSNNYSNSNNKEEYDSTLNNKLNKIGIEVKTIYDYWQSKKIKKHQVLSEKIINIIKQALKTYDIDAIKQAIDRYEEVLHDNDYYFDTVWGLDKFLKQSNALPEFLDDGDKWISYQNKKSKQPKTTVKTGGDAIDELLRQELEKEMNEQGEIVI